MNNIFKGYQIYFPDSKKYFTNDGIKPELFIDKFDAIQVMENFTDLEVGEEFEIKEIYFCGAKNI